MPASLASVVARWFASHLIVFSLLGFAFAGLVVFDMVDLDGPPGSKSGAARETGVAGGGMQDPVAASPTTLVPVPHAAPGTTIDAQAKPPKSDRPPVSRGPRLIGGTLPVYDHAATDRPADLPSPDGFRPRFDDATPEMAPPPTREQYVQQARRAFWNGDFERAEAAYMDVIAMHPDDADAFGELGNLYQSMGKPALARDAFFEAALRLKERGDGERLKQMVDLLEKEGDDRAAELRN